MQLLMRRASQSRAPPGCHPRRGLDIEGSVEGRLGSFCCIVMYVLTVTNMHVSEIVMTQPLKIRRNRTKNEDLFVEKSLFDLELQYGSTEAGRLLQTSTLICT